MQKSTQQIYVARGDMQRDVVEIESVRTKLWEAMQKLGGAVHFAETLDAKLAAKVDSRQATDPTIGIEKIKEMFGLWDTEQTAATAWPCGWFIK